MKEPDLQNVLALGFWTHYSTLWTPRLNKHIETGMPICVYCFDRFNQIDKD